MEVSSGVYYRIITRCVGPEGWYLGWQPQDQGSHAHGVFWDQGSGCAVFVGSGIKISYTFWIRDQNFGITDENSIPRYGPDISKLQQ